MNIIVKYRSVYGKELFYPMSEDAKFITEVTGRPTILKKQMELFSKRGWSVLIVSDELKKVSEVLSDKFSCVGSEVEVKQSISDCGQKLKFYTIPPQCCSN